MGIFRSILFGVHDGMKEAGKKKKPGEWEYENLEHTPFLHSSDYLNELYEDAQYNWQRDAVKDHMERHDVLGKGYRYDKIGRR